jgi:hypothetical protein
MRDKHDIPSDIPLLAEAGREPGADCPDEAVLAAYAESALGIEEREALEDHVADCSHCLGQVGFLVREAEAELPAVPTDLLDAARRRRRSHWLAWPKAPAWAPLAAAAVLVIAVTAALQLDLVPSLSEPGSPAPEVSREPAPGTARERQVRNGGPPHSLTVIEPQEGAEVRSSGAEVRWHPSPQALQYTVLLVSLEGDLLWEGSTASSRLEIPPAAVAPGERYFVWIEARLPGGGTLKSDAVGFHTAPE